MYMYAWAPPEGVFPPIQGRYRYSLVHLSFMCVVLLQARKVVLSYNG